RCPTYHHPLYPHDGRTDDPRQQTDRYLGSQVLSDDRLDYVRVWRAGSGVRMEPDHYGHRLFAARRHWYRAPDPTGLHLNHRLLPGCEGTRQILRDHQWRRWDRSRSGAAHWWTYYK